jgi:hypothetical protein
MTILSLCLTNRFFKYNVIDMLSSFTTENATQANVIDDMGTKTETDTESKNLII